MATTAATVSRHPADALAAVREELERLVVERQRLRATDADADALEANRRAIADRQLRFAYLAWRCYGHGSGPAPLV
jgi:DNA-binding GntR family transcriptional regulator